MKRNDAVLLLGPTGAGKTPLGDALAESGVGNRRCLHFDFGASLRRIAVGEAVPDTFGDDDLHIVREALTAGVLLEDETFHVAEKILHAFMKNMAVCDRDLVILNGLPRHVGQARDTERLVNMSAVLFLECAPDIVRARIRQNTGGDRTDRPDDSLAQIQAKLETFQERTHPLLQYYANKDIPVHGLNVGTDTTIRVLSKKEMEHR